MMKMGLNTAILPDATFEEVIDYCAKLGLRCVEVCCWPKGKAVRRYAGVTHIDIDQSDDAKLAYYVSYAKERGIDISALAYYPNALDPDREAAEAVIAHLYKVIGAAAKMGVNMVTTFIGRDKTKNVEENLELYAKIWPPIVKAAEEKGVRIAIENCPMLFTKDEWPGGNNIACSPAIWREMFKIIPSDYLGINYDPSHLYLIHSDYVLPLYEFKDKIFHVHFKDVKIYPEKLVEYGVLAYPTKWHSPKLPGLGGVDFGAFISALNDIRFGGYACIEIEDKAFEACPEDVRSGIEQTVRFLSQYM